MLDAKASQLETLGQGYLGSYALPCPGRPSHSDSYRTWVGPHASRWDESVVPLGVQSSYGVRLGLFPSALHLSLLPLSITCRWIPGSGSASREPNLQDARRSSKVPAGADILVKRLWRGLPAVAENEAGGRGRGRAGASTHPPMVVQAGVSVTCHSKGPEYHTDG